jgi:two-component system sensor histidine kinase TctE
VTLALDTVPRFRSLRARLTGAVMVPLIALVIIFGGLTCWFMHTSQWRTADRVMVGSVRTLSLALSVDEHLRPQLMPLALHLLQRRARPVVHYSIYHGDTLIAGMAELKPPADYDLNDHVVDRHPPATFPQPFRDTPLHRGYIEEDDARSVVQAAYLRDTVLNGKSVRIATEIRRINGDPHALAIQIADFVDDRRAYEQGLFLQVIGGGVLILITAVLLFFWAITWGLTPFSALTAQVENAQDGAPAHFRLSAPPSTPREMMPFIQAFNALMGRIERVTDSLRQFTSNASHQLRTPLTIVRVHLDALERHGPNSTQGRAALRDVTAAVTSLERLLLQLITLARTEEQAIDPAMSFDLAETAAAVTTDRVIHIIDPDLDLAYEREDDEPVLALGHPILAAELIGNLVDNAIRYNRPGGSVIVRIRRSEGRARIEIEDDGPGIPPEERERVWERFYRAANQQDRVGSGLGLPIVRALAAQMGAVVSLSSGAHGQGLCATVDFRAAA